MSNISYTDIQNTSWVYRITPSSWHAYINLMRLDRPVGIYLLYIPCLWGLFLGQSTSSAPTLSLFKLILLFVLGAIVMRGAGCVINDIWDRDFDRAVERTKLRPIAAGAVSVRKALFFAAFLSLIGFLILVQLPPIAIGLGIISLVPVCLYPLAKRVTWYPQIVLGLTFNFGVLIGGASLITDPSWQDFIPIVMLYIAAIFWTIGYDTIYAHQDIEDDQKIGIKSTAQKFGVHSFELILLCYVVMAILIAGSCFLIKLNSPLLWVTYTISLLWMMYRHFTWDPNNPHDCLSVFKSHVTVGFGIALALYFATLSV